MTTTTVLSTMTMMVLLTVVVDGGGGSHHHHLLMFLAVGRLVCDSYLVILFLRCSRPSHSSSHLGVQGAVYMKSEGVHP